MCLKRGQKKATKPVGFDSTIESLESDGYMRVRRLPKEVEVTPPKAIFACGITGKPTDCAVTIANNSAKMAAYKVLTSHNALFKVDSPSGTVPAGEEKILTVEYSNTLDVNTIEGIFYLRVFIALIETDTLPEDFRPENESVPKVYDGEHFMACAFTTERKFKIVPVPKDIDIKPGSVPFKCGSLGKPVFNGMLITNNSQRSVAYKVIRLDPVNFKVIGRAGVIAPGQNKVAKVKFMNAQEVAKENYFFVFVAYVDSNTLPEEFAKNLLTPPATFDGVKVLPIDIKYDAPPPPSPDEKGPPSQTGGPTETDFGTGASPGAAAPSAEVPAATDAAAATPTAAVA